MAPPPVSPHCDKDAGRRGGIAMPLAIPCDRCPHPAPAPVAAVLLLLLLPLALFLLHCVPAFCYMVWLHNIVNRLMIKANG